MVDLSLDNLEDSKLKGVEDKVITLFRLSLGLIFLWFGLLKIAGYNPVFDIVNGTFPYFATGHGNIILGVAETLIGVLLLVNLLPLLVHVALIIHLLGTLLAFFTASDVLFSPQFPVLTLAGEFVFKNISLAVGGVLVMIHERRRKELEDV